MELVQSANLEDKPSSRVDQIDVMRGFALLGIGLENIFSMHTTNALFADYSNRYGYGVNHFLLLGLMILVRSKFYPIFSFVFGASAALGLPSQSNGFFLRRLGGLFLLGMLQIIFIWEGDVLVQYVFMGCLLLLLKNWVEGALVAIGILLLIFSFVGELWSFPEQAKSVGDLYIYKTGSFIELMMFRIEEYLQNVFTWQALLFYCRIFAFMLLGYAFVKSKKTQLLTSPARLWKVFLPHLVLVVGIAIMVQVLGWRGEASDRMWVKELVLSVYFYAAVICLASLPVMLWQIPILHHVLTPLKWLGRLTLTHYLTQNLLFSLLFYGYGLGLFYQLEPWQCMLLYSVIIAIQLYLSIWLLKRFRLGPVEYFLRWVAGKKRKASLD